MVHSRQACSKASTSKRLSASRNIIRFSEARLHAVSSRNMYSEHGFDARIGPDFGQVCQSLMVVWNWMPGSAEAQAAWPIFSHRSRALSVFTVLPPRRAVRFQSPSSLDRVQELVGHAHRVVGVLARDGQVGLAVPVGVVGGELDLLVALARELDDAADVVVGHQVAARFLDGALERGVLGRLEAGLAFRLAVDAGLHDGLEPPLADLGAGHERRDLLLLLHLPVDVGLDVGMVDVDHHHLGGAPRGAARLDGAGGAVADPAGSSSGPTTCRRPTASRSRSAAWRSWSRCPSRT